MPSVPHLPAAEHSHTRHRQATGPVPSGAGHVWVTHGSPLWGRVSSSSGEQHQLPLNGPPVCCRLGVPSRVAVLRRHCVGEASPRAQRGRGRGISPPLVRAPSPVCAEAALTCGWPAAAWPQVCGRCLAVCQPCGPAFPLRTSSRPH